MRTTICCRCFARIAVTAACLILTLLASRAAAQGIPDTPRWSTTIPAAPAGGAVVAGPVVVVPLQDETLAAYSLEDGSALWTTAMTPTQPLAADAHRLYVVAGESVQALDRATGRATWRLALEGPATAPPVVHAGWLLVAAAGELLALRAADGDLVWRRPIGGVGFRPAVDGDLLVVSVDDGHVIALDLPTGAVRWTRALGAQPAEPLVIAGRIYVGTTNAKWFYALHASNGRPDWVSAGGVTRGRPAFDERHVYYTGMDNILRALDLRNGSRRWQSGVPYRPLAGPVVLPGGVTVPGVNVQALPVFRRTDGSPAGTVPFAAALTAVPAFGAAGDGAPLAVGIIGTLEEEWSITRVDGRIVPVLPLAPLEELPGEIVPIATS